VNFTCRAIRRLSFALPQAVQKCASLELLVCEGTPLNSIEVESNYNWHRAGDKGRVYILFAQRLTRQSVIGRLFPTRIIAMCARLAFSVRLYRGSNLILRSSRALLDERALLNCGGLTLNGGVLGCAAHAYTPAAP
jgi:hypothetical protein